MMINFPIGLIGQHDGLYTEPSLIIIPGLIRKSGAFCF